MQLASLDSLIQYVGCSVVSMEMMVYLGLGVDEADPVLVDGDQQNLGEVGLCGLLERGEERQDICLYINRIKCINIEFM